MSEAAIPASSSPAPAPRRQRHPVWRVVGWIFLSLTLLVVLLLAGVAWYTTTADFQRRARAEVVNVLQNSTGGRVELQHIKFNLWHLAIEADGLVIHGTEGPGQMPYLSASKIFVRVRINTFLSHTVGSGPQSHIGLNYLRVEEPHFHLIIDKDGKTNQPVPKHPSTSTTPIQDTLLDLQAGKVELANGLAVLNDRAIPFDIAARDLNAEVHYIAATDRYGATLDLADLETKIANQPAVQSKLHLTAELGRDMVQLTKLDLSTGGTTHLTASAQLNHFAHPQWKASVAGGIDLKQLTYLADVSGLDAGTLQLSLNGHSCDVTPQVAQKHPRFWQRRSKLPPAAKVLPPSPDCKAGYLMVGDIKLNNAGYRNENVRLHDINASAQLHITPTQLLFTTLVGYLPGGGGISGALKIDNWLGEAPANAAAKSPTTVAAATTANTAAKGIGAAPPVKSLNTTVVQRAQAYLTVNVDRIPLRTIMDITARPNYGDLGFDTSITGPVTVEWGGPATEISDTVQVQAGLKFAPTGVHRRGALSNLPVSGSVVGHYDGSTEVVRISQLALQTPQTTLDASGVLGVNAGDPLTNLRMNLDASNLGEFDQLLQTLGFEANGKKGSAAIPVVLHGTAEFDGTARGAIRNLDVKGHLAANDLAVQLGSEADVHIDSLVAEGEYTPTAGVAVASSTITRGTAVLNVAGTFKPYRAVSRRGVISYEWNDQLGINATVKLANAQIPDLLQIAGQQQKFPITGTIDVSAHAAGTLKNLDGGGSITLNNGVAYGEKYQAVAVNLSVQGNQIDASRILLQAHDMTISGSGGYNLASKSITAQLAGNNLRLSKFDVVQRANPNADGVLSFSLDAKGTVEQPNLHAKLSLANISVQGKSIGELNATAYSSGSNVFYDLHSTLADTQLNASGETALTGDYQTQAKLSLSGLDIANVITLVAPGSFKGSSNIAGTVTISGPAAKPQQIAGTAEFGNVDLKLEGIELKAAQPLRASLNDGIVTLDQLHITGADTDLQAAGRAQVFGSTNPQGGAIHLNANGSVSMALAHTFDKDLITSGKVSFKVAANGRMKKPSLTGDVLFQNVNLAVEGIPNGLSNMNGTLTFNEDRLDVKNLTANTGGGQLKIGGFLAYQKGIFADLTATGDAVRVRYGGLSATATAAFRLQGGPQSVLLSGNILVTRFGVGADVDFASFAGAGGVQAPPDPSSATNKVRLDIHITSAPQMDFQNSYAKLAGTVDLRVGGTLAVPSVLGRIQITDGSATFAGTTYELQRGMIYFNNPVRIDPIIDLDATARVENYNITIAVDGSPSNLKPTYRSEPPLTEADIFNLLALGRTQEESQLSQQQQSQAGEDPTTNALLGGALNATVSNRVGKLFGAGSIKIDPAFVGTLGNSAARITVQEPLSKQLTLVFATNVNETAEQLIQLQYQVNENDSIVATRDESGVFSIVYKIRKRYR
jgi:translocation and assembly module TamB